MGATIAMVRFLVDTSLDGEVRMETMWLYQVNKHFSNQVSDIQQYWWDVKEAPEAQYLRNCGSAISFVVDRRKTEGKHRLRFVARPQLAGAPKSSCCDGAFAIWRRK